MDPDEEDDFDPKESAIAAVVVMEMESEEGVVNVQRLVLHFHKRWRMKPCLLILMVSRGVHVVLNRRNRETRNERLDSGNLSTECYDRYKIGNIGEQKSFFFV